MAKRKPKLEGEMTWRDLEIGAIVTDVTGQGSASRYKTGDWRSQGTTYDFTKCIKCGLCQIYCPEGCIEQNEDGYFAANVYYCKGCGICARECPTQVITMVVEEE